MPGVTTVSAAASCANAATGATSARKATVAHPRTPADRPIRPPSSITIDARRELRVREFRTAHIVVHVCIHVCNGSTPPPRCLCHSERSGRPGVVRCQFTAAPDRGEPPREPPDCAANRTWGQRVTPGMLRFDEHPGGCVPRGSRLEPRPSHLRYASRLIQPVNFGLFRSGVGTTKFTSVPNLRPSL